VIIVRIAVVALVVTAASLLAFSPGEAQKAPADFQYEKGKDSPGPVNFSHETHKSSAEKCTVCHTKIFKMKKGQTGTPTMADMKAGKQCGACHDGKTKTGDKVAFGMEDKAKCDSCHKK
jgi:c(7)-type cytochrome triheme protein